MTVTIVTQGEDETIAAGRVLGAGLRVGSVLLLRGELGAGKTAFVRGVAEGLGVPADDVSSPTFTLIQEYRGRLPLYHVDLYRLDARGADDLGLEELAEAGAMAVEWAERWSRPAGQTITVRFEDLGSTQRRLRITGPDAPLLALRDRIPGAYSDR